MQTLRSPETGDRAHRHQLSRLDPAAVASAGSASRKRKIGYDVARAAADYPLTVDISSRWADRIGGTAWFDFLGRSRAVLGVESATCLFDFTGEVENWCREFEKAHPEADHLSEEFYLEAHRGIPPPVRGQFQIRSRSRRGTSRRRRRDRCKSSMRASIRGCCCPDRHFVPLRRDLANFAEVVDFLRDDRRVSEMVECAYEEIVLDPRCTTRALSSGSTKRSIGRWRARASGVAIAIGAKPAARAGAGRPRADDRSAHRMDGGRADARLRGLRARRPSPDPGEPSARLGSFARGAGCGRGSTATGTTTRSCRTILDMNSAGPIGLQHLMLLRLVSELPAKSLEDAVGALDATDEDLGRFRWLARHFYDTNCALLRGRPPHRRASRRSLRPIWERCRRH